MLWLMHMSLRSLRLCEITIRSGRGASLDWSGSHQLVVLRLWVFGHKGVGAQALVVAQIQQRQHHPLVLLGQVGEHEGIRGRLQQQPDIFGRAQASAAISVSRGAATLATPGMGPVAVRSM